MNAYTLTAPLILALPLLTLSLALLVEARSPTGIIGRSTFYEASSRRAWRRVKTLTGLTLAASTLIAVAAGLLYGLAAEASIMAASLIVADIVGDLYGRRLAEEALISEPPASTEHEPLEPVRAWDGPLKATVCYSTISSIALLALVAAAGIVHAVPLATALAASSMRHLYLQARGEPPAVHRPYAKTLLYLAMPG
ncbi:MAG: hypothetical protein GSR78_01850, partial [Desulfurococcales archaeon]|nr:hypothetical protein [Desulfurococcales archaeon]